MHFARALLSNSAGLFDPLNLMNSVPRQGKLNAILLAVLLLPGAEVLGRDQAMPATPVDLVRKTVRNEIDAADGHVKFLFREEKANGRGSQTKLVVETDESMVGMLIGENGRPLTPDRRRAEEARLANYVNNSSELNKKLEREREEAEHTRRIVAALPDAFLYENDGTVPGTASLGRLGDVLVRLKFRPRPDYNPPTHAEQVLTAMAGYLLIDTTEFRIAKIDGALVKDVGFGWGILGRLDPGGRFMVEQADVGGGHWEATRMDLAFTGKLMLFKSLSIRSSEVFSDFRPAPSNLNFAQGVALLKKEQSELAQDPQQAAIANRQVSQTRR
jgi:hypothetical protein